MAALPWCILPALPSLLQISPHRSLLFTDSWLCLAALGGRSLASGRGKERACVTKVMETLFREAGALCPPLPVCPPQGVPAPQAWLFRSRRLVFLFFLRGLVPIQLRELWQGILCDRTLLGSITHGCCPCCPQPTPRLLSAFRLLLSRSQGTTQRFRVTWKRDIGPFLGGTGSLRPRRLQSRCGSTGQQPLS